MGRDCRQDEQIQELQEEIDGLREDVARLDRIVSHLFILIGGVTAIATGQAGTAQELAPHCEKSSEVLGDLIKEPPEEDQT